MKKLWDKGYGINSKVEQFTTGNDYLLDYKLIKYDCIASIAHARMLNKLGILENQEFVELVDGLNEIIQLNENGEFVIKQEDEDCHTAIENYLTKECGEAGKKIHSLRSRNDQVFTAIKLYEKNELSEIKELMEEFKKAIQIAIEKYGSIKMPGYTHMQKAMPTDVNTWLGSFIEGCNDDIILLDATIKIVDQSPLGSAAGFGVPVFNIDKEMTAKEMDFSKVMNNPMHVQMSRGKIESSIIHLLTQILYDLNKLATDLTLFTMKEFGFVILPKEFCTGSSIMPQKNNPDVIELVKAKYSVVLGEEFKVKSMIGNLISGYNRDIQLTKEPLFNSIDITKETLEIMSLVVSNMSIDEEKCEKALTKEIYATEEAYMLVKKGVPFREAYKIVAKNLN